MHAVLRVRALEGGGSTELKGVNSLFDAKQRELALSPAFIQTEMPNLSLFYF